MHNMLCLLVFVFAVQTSWLQAQESPACFDDSLVTDVASRSITSDSVYLLQVGAHHLRASHIHYSSYSKTLPPTGNRFKQLQSLLMRDIEETEEDGDDDDDDYYDDDVFDDLDDDDDDDDDQQLEDPIDSKNQDALDPGINLYSDMKEVGVLGPLTWVFGAYHKTGVELSLGICETLSGGNLTTILGKRVVKLTSQGEGEPLGYKIERQLSDSFNNRAFGNWFFEPRVGIIKQIPNYRFVHMIRNPSQMVVSAYHWHLAPQHEPWLKFPMKKHFCYEEEMCLKPFSRYGFLPAILYNPAKFNELVLPEHNDILIRYNASVQANRTLPGFYRRASRHDGIIIEAYREMWTLNLMVDNYLQSRQDERSVHVRMEHILNDFNSTMGCMFSFLQNSYPFNDKWAMMKVAKFDVSMYGSSASVNNPDHISSMPQNQTEELLRILDTVPWVPKARQQLWLPAINDC